jgi:hypothetical protein
MSGSRHFKKAAHFFSREQFRAGRREGDEGPRLMHFGPAALDREFQARAVFGRAAEVSEHSQSVTMQFLNKVIRFPMPRLRCRILELATSGKALYLKARLSSNRSAQTEIQRPRSDR